MENLFCLNLYWNSVTRFEILSTSSADGVNFRRETLLHILVSDKSIKFKLLDGRYTGCFKSRFTTWTYSNNSCFHNLAKMTTKDACTSSKMAHPLITIETSASASTPFSQGGGMVDGRRYHGHLVSPILLRWIFCLWGFVKHRVYVPPLPANVA
jgi:hypothetical protein